MAPSPAPAVISAPISHFKTATSDLLAVSGTAKINGAIVINLVNPGFAAPVDHHVHDRVGGRGETHSPLTLLGFQSAAVSYALSYPNSTDIDLSVTFNFAPPTGPFTRNQFAVANAINAIQNAGVTSFGTVASPLFDLTSLAALGAAYDLISGEGVSAVEQAAFDANDVYHSSILQEAQFWLFDEEQGDPHSQVFYAGMPLGYAPQKHDNTDSIFPINASAPAQRTWRLWYMGQGGSWNYSGNAAVGSAAVHDWGGGFSAGMDYQISPNLLWGFVAGYGDFAFSVPDRVTSGTVQAAHIGPYVAARNGNAYATAMLDFDYFYNIENRSPAVPGTALTLFGLPTLIPGVSESDTGKFGSYSVSGQFETGYLVHLSRFDVTPFVGIEFNELHLNGFTEVANGTPSGLALSFGSLNVASVPAYIGAQIDNQTTTSDGYLLHSWLRAAWVHDFDTQRLIDSDLHLRAGLRLCAARRAGRHRSGAGQAAA